MKEYIYQNEYNSFKTEYVILLRLFLSFFIMMSVGLLCQVCLEKYDPIYEGALRFHVRADSDDPMAQKLKLKVRDAVLYEISDEVRKADSAEELLSLLKKEQDEIGNSALACLKKEGSSQAVKVQYTRERFPARWYGRVFFPAGTYQAVRVDIGRGKGHNWWCALYPELCYNINGLTISEKGREDLKRIFLRRDPEAGAKSPR